MNRKKLEKFLFHKIKHRLIFHHEYDWYCCEEDGTFCLLKGSVFGPDWDGIFVLGPYKTQLLAYIAYKRATGEKNILVTRRVCREKEKNND